MRTTNTYFEQIYHEACSEKIDVDIIIEESFFKEHDMNPYCIHMDNIFGFRPKAYRHPNFIVSDNDSLVGQAITRVSLLKPVYFNNFDSALDRTSVKVVLNNKDMYNINTILNSDADIIANPIIDVSKKMRYNEYKPITVYQYLLFIYNTGAVNLTPSKFTRTNRYETEDYILNITSDNIDGVLNKHYACVFTNTKPIPMDYEMLNYDSMEHVNINDL